MNEQSIRKRRLLLVLPLVALPFVTLLFWAAGGGSENSEKQPVKKDGLNTSLPGAKLAEGDPDKLSLYDQAQKDSLKREEDRRADPYGRFGQPVDSGALRSPVVGFPGTGQGYNYGSMGISTMGRTDATEAQLRSRLEALEAQLEQTTHEDRAGSRSYGANESYSHAYRELDQLQSSLAAGGSETTSTEPDPELDKINTMLEKVIDIQNPGRAKEKLKEQSIKNRGMVYSVSQPTEMTRADYFGSSARTSKKNKDTGEQRIITAGFYETGGEDTPDGQESKAVPAVVHETQTLVSGATIKMRLVEDIFINGVNIPKGTYVFGTCALDGERMHIEVKGVRYRNAVFPVSLEVFDMDGISGIRIPGAIGRDATKEGADQAIQGLDLFTMDQNLGAQAVGAGIQTAKSLFGKKTKLIRATVKAGYPLLLVDQNKRNQ